MTISTYPTVRDLKEMVATILGTEEEWKKYQAFYRQTMAVYTGKSDPDTEQ